MTQQSDNTWFDTNVDRSNVGVIGHNHGSIHFYQSTPGILAPGLLDINAKVTSFLEHYLGTSTQTVPFGGREDDLGALEDWRKEGEKQYLLLAAPAGRGKSALLAHWAKQMSPPRVDEDSDEEVVADPAVVYMPISKRFNTNLAMLVFPCLAVQLAALLRKELPRDTIHMTPEHWQSMVTGFLREEMPDGRQLLVILDGIDEAAWPWGPDVFPFELPKTTRVVVAARSQYDLEQAPETDPWIEKLGWDRFDSAKTMRLDRLSRPALDRVVAAWHRPVDELADEAQVVERLYELTDGDPLLLELHLDRLGELYPAHRGQALDLLAEMEPDYRGFFDKWWEDQRQLWVQQGLGDQSREEAVRALICILALAYGALQLMDLTALAPEHFGSEYDIEEAKRPLERFVLGDGEQIGYSFVHSQLGDYLGAKFLGVHAQAWRERFVDWGQRVIEELQEAEEPDFEGVSRYLLQYYSEHLAAAGAPVEAYLQLLTWEWLKAQYQFTKTYAEFLGDVDKVLDVVVSEDEKAIAAGQLAPYLDKEIISVLCHASANGVSSRLPVDLLIGLRVYGGWTDDQVLFYVQQRPHVEEQVEALIEIAPFLASERQTKVFHHALNVAAEILDEPILASALAALAPHLPVEVHRAAKAVESEGSLTKILMHLSPRLPLVVYDEAMKLKSEVHQALLLAELIPHLEETQRPQVIRRVLRVAAEADFKFVMHIDSYLNVTLYRVLILARLAPWLVETQRKEVLDQAIQLVLEMNMERDIAWAITALVSLLPEKVLQVALGLDIEKYQAIALAELAPHLPEVVYEAALELKNPVHRMLVLSVLPQHLEESRREQAITQALELVFTESNDLLAQSRSFRELAPELPEFEQTRLLSQMLQSSIQLADVAERGSALAMMIPQIPHSQQERVVASVYRTALETKDDPGRALLFSVVAPYLPEPDKTQSLDMAFRITLGLQFESERVIPLIALAPERPKEVLSAAKLMHETEAQVEVLSALARYLPDEVYAIAQDFQYTSNRVLLFGSLAPYLSEAHRREVVVLVPELLRRIRSHESDRARLLSSLAPYLSDEELDRLLREELRRLLDKVYVDFEFDSPSNMLSALAPHLPEDVYEASDGLGTLERLKVLVALAPYLPETVYRDVGEMEFEYAAHVRSAVAGVLAGPLSEKPPVEVYAFWQRTLGDLMQLDRKSVWTTLWQLVPVIEKLGGKEALERTVNAVEDVARWWP